ncbi:hypothetical protein Q0M30_16820, partial [Staphylococcus aureus]|nr:hypothetical protein [Staphylococcus aureus]
PCRLLTLLAALLLLAVPAAAAGGPPAGRGSYADLGRLFEEFTGWRDNPSPVGSINFAEARVQVRDHGPEAMARRRAEMDRFLARAAD